MHPDTEIKYKSKEIGYGVYATKMIPAGTIMYVQCGLDIVIPKDSPLMSDTRYLSTIKKFAFVGPEGEHVVGWDNSRFVNHCCHPNTVTTGYGFEIAVRDIGQGQEITSDYGLFNMEPDLPVSCFNKGCRGVVRRCDFDKLSAKYDEIIRGALPALCDVDQPLFSFLDYETIERLGDFFGRGEYLPLSAVKEKTQPPR